MSSDSHDRFSSQAMPNGFWGMQSPKSGTMQAQPVQNLRVLHSCDCLFFTRPTTVKCMQSPNRPLGITGRRIQSRAALFSSSRQTFSETQCMLLAHTVRSTAVSYGSGSLTALVQLCPNTFPLTGPSSPCNPRPKRQAPPATTKRERK